MPIETNLTGSPYFDDYNETKDFYKVLFQPSVSVQVRELNQLQTILQKQVERFGDNIFKRGALIDGCNFGFLNPYRYVKLLDNETNGTPAALSTYKGMFATEETSNLKAFIINYQEGFETSDPDLNTLYVQYINSGDDQNTTSFTAGRILTITDSTTSVFRISVENGGVAFSNSDDVIVSSALVVNVTTGAITNGIYLNNGTANVQVVEVDEDTLADSDQVIIRIVPRDADLANASVNAAAWSIANGDAITNPGATIAATVEAVIGSGLTCTLETDGVGTVTDINVIDRGQNYTTLPTIRIQSANNTTGLADLDLVAQNYLAKIRSASVASAIGNGYAFSVTSGVIYQKGYFLRVEPQTVIVEKYSQTPNNLVVGFNTVESIVTSSIDSTLLDNALETENENAPGADRLKLVPTLVVADADSVTANDQFFPIVQWSEGLPFKQNQQTAYNKINDQMAERLFDQDGNFAVDRFNVTTRTPAAQNASGEYISAVVDPGTAYISGYKVKTNHNFVIDIKKGTDTVINPLRRVSVNYGNYIRCNELGGVFQFSTGDTVKFYDTAKQMLTNVAAAVVGNTTPVGTQIGTGRIRSIVLEDGTAGTPSAIYRLYLFDISMNAGQSTRSIKSVYYDGTNKGIADAILELDGTTAANIAVIRDPDLSKLLFDSGVRSLKNANGVIYQYRTIDQTATVSNNGILTKDISATVDEFFPYSGNLTSSQLRELYVVPIDIGFQSSADATGNISCNTTSANIVGDGTTFIADFAVGDYVNLYSSSPANDQVKRITAITNNTLMVVDSNVDFSHADGRARRYFPKYIPVPLGTRSGLIANVDSNGNILTVNFGLNIDSATTTNCAIAVNIERRNATQITKTANRQKFIKISTSNNAGNTVGPWCLGVADVFRLRGVYLGVNSSVANTDINVTSHFYIDHNQNLNYYNQSYLYKKPTSRLSISNTAYLLVEFDYFTSSGSGYADTVSYNSANATQIFLTDSQPLTNLTSTVNSLEIPAVYSSRGQLFDLHNQFDFRPVVESTATPASAHGSAPVNPAINISFGNTASALNDKKFPVPDHTMQAVVENWVGRNDAVIVDKNGQISVLKGTETRTPTIPSDAMLLDVLTVPPYPVIPRMLSSNAQILLDTKLANEIYITRTNNYQVKQNSTEQIIQRSQPGRFTKAHAAQLERRVRNLEYYVSLSMLETDITNRIIPSSLDPTLNRFKYGFFADEFENYLYSDVRNPQYASTRETYNKRTYIAPFKYNWAVYGPNLAGHPPYVDYPAIEQLNATLTGPSVNCVPNSAYAYVYSIRRQYSSLEAGNTASGFADSFSNVMFSNVSATATLYFDAGISTKIEIYQGNTLLITSNSAQALTTSNKALLGSNTIPAGWFNGSNLNSSFSSIGNGYVSAVGKISWTHSPTSGRFYTIVTTKGSNNREWRYALEIPVDANSVGCVFAPDSNTGPNTPASPSYTGTMTAVPDTITYISFIDPGGDGIADGGSN